jgi:predicted transposase YdaD
MSKPFDATLKWLLEMHPADWPTFLGVPVRSAEVVDADVSTVSAAADKVLRVRADDGDCIQHFDFQSGPDASVPRRVHSYNALLEERHELPLDSVVVLLRPEANLRTIDGVYQRGLPGAPRPYLHFGYRVIRAWELPVESVLRAGISVLPLAPISAVGQNELPAVILHLKQGFAPEADPATEAELSTATEILLGMRYQAAFVAQLLQGIHTMRESTTYQAILDEGRREGREKGRQEGRQEGQQEGRLEAVREDIRRLGQRKFHTPLPAHVQAALASNRDWEQLHQMLERILDVSSWDEFMASPSAQPSPTPKDGNHQTA